MSSNDPKPQPGTNPSEPPLRRVPLRERLRTGEKPRSLEKEDFPFQGNSPKIRELDAMIEAEMSAALGGMDPGAMLGGSKPKQKPNPEEPRKKPKGTIVLIRGRDVFVEIPGKRIQGLLSLDQFDEPPRVGDEVEFEIEGVDGANGLLKLTREGAAVFVDWSSVGRGQIVEARVIGTNKGGLSVEVNGIRGFLPISQIDLYRVENIEQFMNARFRCLVTEADPIEKNLVVSRRALLEQEREAKREQFFGAIAEGQIREGVVRQVKPFGVFVDLGGADGLIPVSELAWTRVEDPNAVVSVGQKVQVKVMRIDPTTKRISLSLKQLAGNPWDEFAAAHRPGTRINGKVTRTQAFGAFVELAPGIEGLIHISELSPQRVRSVSEVVKVDQEVEVLILSIDTATRRIALSLKAIIAEARRKENEEAQAALEAKKAAEEAAEAEALPTAPPRKRAFPLRGGLGAPE